MAIERSIHHRVRSAVTALLLANTDIRATCVTDDPAQFRIYDGPIAEQPDAIIVRQINVTNAPGSWAYGISGVRDIEVPIDVHFFDAYWSRAVPNSGTDGLDVVNAIVKALAAGSDANNKGRLIDPDAPVDPTPVQKYVTTELEGIEWAMFPMLQEKILHYVIRARYKTRIDDNTLQRA